MGRNQTLKIGSYKRMNKKKAIGNQPESEATEGTEKKRTTFEKYFMYASIFVLSFIYFYFYGNYVFFYQENLSLFVFSRDYLNQFTAKPGGLLEYAGNFLIQGYSSNMYGSILLSVTFVTIALIFYRINLKLLPERSFSLPFAALATCLLIAMQANINYLFHNNIGFLLTALYFMFSVSCERKSCRVLQFVLLPLFYYLTGAYSLIYLGMFLIYNVLKKRFLVPVILVAIFCLTLLFFKNLVFFQPWFDLFYYPLPVKDYFIHPVILLVFFLFFVLYPAIFIITDSSIKIDENKKRIYNLSFITITILVAVFLLSKIYSKNSADLFQLERKFLARDWDGVVRYQEKIQSRNPVAQFYYNIALSEKGLLCDRMFFAPQDFGTMSISIPWNSAISMNKMFRGVYFYYTIGLINETHRWAFESMVIQGYRPENIKLLIKTNLINGHYKIAGKYIHVLKQTLKYRQLAMHYEKMLDNPELIKSDPELGEKVNLKPGDNFIVTIRNPHRNILSLLQSNPANRKAFEYNMAWMLLDKNIEGVAKDLYRLKDLNYNRIPRHIEEALLIYRTVVGPFIDLNQFSISKETETRLARYKSAASGIVRSGQSVGAMLQKEFKNTYWYYFDFVKH